jgi:hypothetical protein
MSMQQLVAVAAKQRTLEEVTRWAVASGHRLLDVITQDEYTHDVVVAADELFLVYDTT